MAQRTSASAVALFATLASIGLGASGVAAAPEPRALVVCAPGYPSSTEQAQPSMDALSRAIERAAGWPGGTLRAVYHPVLDDGRSALRGEDAALAMVPLPFYLQYGEALGLRPLVQVETTGGADEVWSVVARKGAIARPEDVGGWRLVGLPGYSPAFVRHVALAGWGALPDDATIEFDGRVLSALRRAAADQPVAALLDRVQSESLGTLPFGDRLEIVTRSAPLIGSLVCEVGGRLGDERARQVREALLGLREGEGGVELLESLRMRGFVPLDRTRLAGLERAFAGGGSPAP